MSPKRDRLAAIDWMRGLVMVLMTIDHAAEAFNKSHLTSDSAVVYHGEPLDTAQFLTRFITHLCAPTFVFLAGTALALSVTRRAAAGEPARDIDRHIITRGLLIAALDPLWMCLGFSGYRFIVLQVLYAIGISLVCMAGLRRLPRWALLTGGIVLIAGIDALISAVAAAPHPAAPHGVEGPDHVHATQGSPPLPIGLLISGGMYGKLLV